MTLRGKVAVITGASRGLGAGLAQAFAQEGLRLGLCARSAPALSEGPDVVAARLDVRDAAAVQRFCAQVSARLGPIDLWINNAALLDPIGPVRDLDLAAARLHMEVNLLGVLHGTQAYLRHRREVGGGGVLLNVSSGAARSAYAGWGAYCAGKAALERLTEVVALEERASGLRAHSVSPGVIDTDMQARIRRATPDEFPQVQRFLDMKAQDAFSTPPFVARHMLALAFDPQPEQAHEVVIRFPPEKG